MRAIFFVSKSFLFESKPILYVRKTFLFTILITIIPWQLWATVLRRTRTQLKILCWFLLLKSVTFREAATRGVAFKSCS